MEKKRQKTIKVEAVRWTGKNGHEVADKLSPGTCCYAVKGPVRYRTLRIGFNLHAVCGDWIIKDAEGVFFVCGPDTFKEVYRFTGKGNYYEVLTANIVSERCSGCMWVYTPETRKENLLDMSLFLIKNKTDRMTSLRIIGGHISIKGLVLLTNFMIEMCENLLNKQQKRNHKRNLTREQVLKRIQKTFCAKTKWKDVKASPSP